MRKIAQIIAILFILGYWGSPVEVVPDIPVVGWIDDLIVTMVMSWAGGFFSGDDGGSYRVIEGNDD